MGKVEFPRDEVTGLRAQGLDQGGPWPQLRDDPQTSNTSKAEEEVSKPLEGLSPSERQDRDPTA